MYPSLVVFLVTSDGCHYKHATDDLPPISVSVVVLLLQTHSLGVELFTPHRGAAWWWCWWRTVENFPFGRVPDKQSGRAPPQIMNISPRLQEKNLIKLRYNQGLYMSNACEGSPQGSPVGPTLWCHAHHALAVWVVISCSTCMGSGSIFDQYPNRVLIATGSEKEGNFHQNNFSITYVATLVPKP